MRKRRGVSTGAAIAALIVGLIVGAGAIYAAAPSLGLGGTTTSTAVSTSTATSVATSTLTTTQTVGAGQTATITNTATVTQTSTATQVSTVSVSGGGGGSLCSSGQTITLGELTDLTSQLASEGVQVKASTTMAVADVNSFLAQAGCTLKFAININDYALDNAKALTQLQAFAAQGISVVVGPLNSGTAKAILQFADSNHIVLISPSSTSPLLAIPNDYLFRTAPNDAAQGLADARILVDRGVKAVIIVERHDTYGDGLANATASRFKALGGNVVDIIPYDTSTTDFTPILTKINSDYQSAVGTYGASAVAISAISFEEFGTMMIQAHSSFPSLLSTPQPWYGTDGEAQDTVITNATTSGPYAAQVKLPSTLYAPLNNSKTVAFGARFAAANHLPCTFYCFGAYDDVWLAALSIIAAGKNDGAAVQAIFSTVANNYYGITGWNGLQASGDRIPTSYQIWKVVTSGGKPVWVLAGTWDFNTDTITWISPP